MARLLLIVLIVAAPLTMTACSSEDLSTEVADAATRTSDAGSSRVRFETRITARGETVRMTGSGIFDYASGKGSVTFDLSELAGSSSTEFGDGRLTVLFDGSVLFYRFPTGSAPAEALPAGKRWIKIDLRRVDATAWRQLGDPTGADSPKVQLQMLRAVSGDIEEVGKESVRGVETTHYRASIDLDKALEVASERGRLSGAERRRLESQLDQFRRQTGAEELPTEFWIDRQGLVRRQTVTLDVRADGQEAEVVTSMELYDFGTEVAIDAPPAAQIVDYSDRLKQPTA